MTLFCGSVSVVGPSWSLVAVGTGVDVAVVVAVDVAVVVAVSREAVGRVGPVRRVGPVTVGREAVGRVRVAVAVAVDVAVGVVAVANIDSSGDTVRTVGDRLAVGAVAIVTVDGAVTVDGLAVGLCHG